MMAAMTTNDNSDKRRAAKRAFFVSLFDLSWRMAGAMLGPLFIGLFIDSRRGHGQSFAFVGFFIGMICGALVIRSIVIKLSKNSSDGGFDV